MGQGTGLKRSDLIEIKDFDPILPEIGKIKIGKKGQFMKSKGGKDFQPPQKLDHFVITTLNRGNDGNLLVDTELMKSLAGLPANASKEKIASISLKEIDIIFPYDEISLNFQTFYGKYSSSKCHCRGNGEVALKLMEDSKSPEWNEIDCKPAVCEFYSPPNPEGTQSCKMNGILSMILMEAPRVGGVYKFRTTSFITIRNIRSALGEILSITNGILAGIPFKLVVKPQQVQPQNMKGAIVVHTVNVEWVGDIPSLLEKAKTVALHRSQARMDLRKLESNAKLALESAPPEIEAKDIVEEFYPQVVEAEIVADKSKPKEPEEKTSEPEVEPAQEEASPEHEGNESKASEPEPEPPKEEKKKDDKSKPKKKKLF